MQGLWWLVGMQGLQGMGALWELRGLLRGRPLFLPSHRAQAFFLLLLIPRLLLLLLLSMPQDRRILVSRAGLATLRRWTQDRRSNMQTALLGREGPQPLHQPVRLASPRL